MSNTYLSFRSKGDPVMIRIARSGSSISDSLAQVFVCIMTHDGFLIGPPTMEVCSKTKEICQSVGYKKRPGKLWVYPTIMKWPESINPTPNGKSSRVVWCAIIPQQHEMTDKYIDMSLELLASWLKAISTPLKIAAYNDGCFFKCERYGGKALVFNEKLNHHLNGMDVEVFYPKFN